MRASSVTASSAGLLAAGLSVRDWAWWRLPGLVRAYIGAVPVAALALVAVAASATAWLPGDLARFGLLLSCGAVSVVVTPRVAYLESGLVRDFLTAWVLPVAILLPPVFAMVIPAPLLILTQWRVHRGAVYRRVFTGAAIGLAYGAASLVFRAIPASFAGTTLGTGTHPLTWTAAVAAAELTGWFLHNALIVVAVKLSDPTARVAGIALNREALLADFAQMDLGILITVVVAVDPVLAVLAVPTVLLARRFMMHAQLLAKSRMDTKTGLLNASTWESEAEREIVRAVRTRSPLCVALLDLDHFKQVNDTHGHLVGDKALRAISAVLREQMRSYDLAGRFGGEEFAILLPQTREDQALAIAERLRTVVAALSVPVSANDRANTRERPRGRRRERPRGGPGGHVRPGDRLDRGGRARPGRFRAHHPARRGRRRPVPGQAGRPEPDPRRDRPPAGPDHPGRPPGTVNPRTVNPRAVNSGTVSSGTANCRTARPGQ